MRMYEEHKLRKGKNALFILPQIFMFLAFLHDFAFPSPLPGRLFFWPDGKFSVSLADEAASVAVIIAAAAWVVSKSDRGEAMLSSGTELGIV